MPSVGSMKSPISETLRTGLVVGMGNPLLDISAVTDKAFLQKYGLKDNDAILAEEKHMSMYEELKKMAGVEYFAGGSTQNSLRVLQWMIQFKDACTFLGAVGKDENANILQKKAEESGLKILYQTKEKFPTGTCAVVVTGLDRSLCANLGAADHFSTDFLSEATVKSVVAEAKFFYSAGFFLTASPESVVAIAEHSIKCNTLLMLNLAAPFIPLAFKDRLMSVFGAIDVLFGNEAEYAAFGEANGLGLAATDLEGLVKAASKMPRTKPGPRICVLTNGAKPTLVACGDDLKSFPVESIEKEKIVDTNGCGDAFVGGFLSMFVQGKEVDECVKAGMYAAREVIQRSGCTYPDKPAFSA